jgi:uncharacterized damage-inducible protein DinB
MISQKSAQDKADRALQRAPAAAETACARRTDGASSAGSQTTPTGRIAMSIAEPIAAELQHEAATTRRLLERVPDQHFGWKPHEKSMTLGRLAGHIAELPGWGRVTLDQDEYDVATAGYKPPSPSRTEEVLQAFDANIAKMMESLKRQPDQRMMAMWRLKKAGQVIVEQPRVAMLRTMVLSHLIHHRGQLSVYLRLKDVPLPSIYGPTADEPM